MTAPKASKVLDLLARLILVLVAIAFFTALVTTVPGVLVVFALVAVVYWAYFRVFP